MGQNRPRKVRKKPPPTKKQIKLDTVFDCPICNSPKCVECSIELKNRIGDANCWKCKARYATNEVTALTEPIDIYYEWIDECERKAKNDPEDDGLPKKKGRWSS